MSAISYRAAKSAPLLPLGQHGSSLLEVLIAVLVLAIGILGAAALQLNALRYSAGAVHTSHASFIAYDMLDRIRANVSELSSYIVEVDGDCRMLSAAAADVVTIDLGDFFEAVTCHLPQGWGHIAVDGALVSIAIGWTDGRVRSGDGQNEFIVSTLVGAYGE